ncbi:DUF1127 domain-containing protein [Breoghania sp. L-A4]|uniref:DUF1127 domain-containing protein n=1 Tax=Breoghania sp. L-A4 TaxID=2304600 RepID=UPI001967911B|nr:DUF1127 domain-containing protein [Breoghania sp. L-A4]
MTVTDYSAYSGFARRTGLLIRLVAAAGHMLRAGWAAMRAAYRRRATRRALDRLEDWALKDIGLVRGAYGFERMPPDDLQ